LAKKKFIQSFTGREELLFFSMLEATKQVIIYLTVYGKQKILLWMALFILRNTRFIYIRRLYRLQGGI